MIHGPYQGCWLSRNHASPDDKLVVATHSASALKYLHSNYVMHLDLHLGNMLVDTPDGELKVYIADLGISELWHDDFTGSAQVWRSVNQLYVLSDLVIERLRQCFIVIVIMCSIICIYI